MSKQQAWKEWLDKHPDVQGRPDRPILWEGFIAGYEVARAQDIAAMCYMCADPDKYGEPQFITGSMRLWHLVGKEKWNAGQCWAQSLRNFVLPTCTKCGHSGMLNPQGICTHECTPMGG